MGAALAATLAACAAIPRTPVPVALMPQAHVLDYPDVRAAAGRRSETMVADLARSFAQESKDDFPVGADGARLYPHLVLSGGGAYGAFGAGLLRGWTGSGKRPVFKIVTGVSTGALIAPFAFVGPDYDPMLETFYTTTSSRQIFVFRSLLQWLRAESLADTGPLDSLIAQHVDDVLLANVARAHDAGRRLYIGTANLDSQGFIVWNMGMIASRGGPGALALFRQVMLASASIPVAFPPVMFDVVADGRRFDELHVDGGVGTRMFYTAGVFSFADVRRAATSEPGREDIYIIHNGRLMSDPRITQRSLLAIASRTLESIGLSAAVGDLFRIHAVAVREDAGYHWITIPEGISLDSNEVFDPAMMSSLFQLGSRMGREGVPWRTRPPGSADVLTSP